MKRQVSFTLTAAVVAGVVASVFCVFWLAGSIATTIALTGMVVALLFATAMGVLVVLDKTFNVFDTHGRAKAEIYSLQLGAGKISTDTHALVLNSDLLRSGVTIHNFDIAQREYAPAGKITVSPIDPPALPTAPAAPLTAVQALQLLPRNSMRWCFGVDQNGQPVIQSITDSVHVLNVASTGIGKTCQTANMLYQLTQGNDRDYFTLMIADLKGDLIDPFKNYCVDTGKGAADYCRIMHRLRVETDRRMAYDLKNGHTIIAVFEEALAIRSNMTKEQLAQYAEDMNYVAITARAYNIFMVACMQVDYSTEEFKDSRGNFMTKMGGAVLPTAAKSMGFINTKLVNQVYDQKKKGQFLLEGPDGARVIQAPRLDLKAGELHRLLGLPIPDTTEQLRKSQEDAYIRQKTATRPAPTGYADFDAKAAQWAATFEQTGSQSTDQGDDAIEGQYRELPPAPSEVEKFVREYKRLGNIRDVQDFLNITYYKAQKLYQAAKEQRLID